MTVSAVVISLALFFLAGLAFGYALGPPTMWIPLAFPLIMALAVTVLGVLLGQRLAPEQRAEEAPG